MEKHYRFNDQQFEKRFSSCHFPASDFTHEAHLRLAWIHIRKYGVEQAVENINDQIKAFADSLNASDNYHNTVTSAAVYAVSHFHKRSSSATFKAFIEEFPQLKTNFLGLLSSHYSYDVAKSEEARKEYLEPDLAPFY